MVLAPERAPETRTDPAPERVRRSLWHPVILAQALLLALVFRLWFVHQTSFPLNDGGLFWAMVDDLERAQFRLPVFTSYNQARIPFVYPPLGLYVVAFLEKLGFARLDLFRYLPTLVTVGSVAAFAALAHRILSSRRASAAATVAFALLPMSFAWPIMGGGVTRAFGQLFSILALLCAYRLYTGGGRWPVFGLALSAAATVLSHPEASWFLAYSVPFFWLVLSRRRDTFLSSLLAALGAVVLVSPWLVTVVARHGTAVFRPLHDSGWSFLSGLGRLALFDVTREPVFPVLGMLALLGVLHEFGQRRYLLPLWLVVIPALQARAFDQRAVIPLALLAGIGLSEVLLPLVGQARLPLDRLRPNHRLRTHALPDGGSLHPVPWWVVQLALLAVILQSTVATAPAYRPLLTGLTPDDRAAMAWVAEHTPSGARFLVLTGETWFGQDRVAEWFPALTGRVNLAVVQGYEWLGDFSERIEAATALQLCASAGRACLEHWAESRGMTYDFVYIARQPYWIDGRRFERFGALISELLRSPDYRLVYDGPGAIIFQHAGGSSIP
ncbi:hypothetical protein OO015_04795 [Thermomicrobium sp. 4228-Ro]|uniref:hypothetical protein n=1 Tax=Thermomicrobium sp. 4228-Ro TaxID=2993937 RepID=UPI00224989E2|nr:hypothetical protein [Thermomicrobium sp. 4228-Ro]MCX2726811.1 hypothetical protein [Thermomicrobium sp. 4228-Ro]